MMMITVMTIMMMVMVMVRIVWNAHLDSSPPVSHPHDVCLPACLLHFEWLIDSTPPVCPPLQ